MIKETHKNHSIPTTSPDQPNLSELCAWNLLEDHLARSILFIEPEPGDSGHDLQSKSFATWNLLLSLEKVKTLKNNSMKRPSTKTKLRAVKPDYPAKGQ